MAGRSLQPQVYDLTEVSPRTVAVPTFSDPATIPTDSPGSHTSKRDSRRTSAGSTPWRDNDNEAMLTEPLPVPQAPSSSSADMLRTLSRDSSVGRGGTPPRAYGIPFGHPAGSPGRSSPHAGSRSGKPSPSRIPVPLVYSPEKRTAAHLRPTYGSPTAGPSRLPASLYRSTSAQNTTSPSRGSPRASPAKMGPASQAMPRSTSQPLSSGYASRSQGSSHSRLTSPPDTNKPLPQPIQTDVDIAVSSPTPVKPRRLSYGSGDSPASSDSKRQGRFFSPSTPPVHTLLPTPQPPAGHQAVAADASEATQRRRPVSYHPPDSPRHSFTSERRRSSQMSPKVRPRGPRPGSHHTRASTSSIGSMASISSAGTAPSELRDSDYEVRHRRSSARASDSSPSILQEGERQPAQRRQQSRSGSPPTPSATKMQVAPPLPAADAVFLGREIPPSVLSSGSSTSAMGSAVGSTRPPRPPMNVHARRQSRGLSSEFGDFGPTSPLEGDDERYTSLPLPGSRAGRAGRRGGTSRTLSGSPRRQAHRELDIAGDADRFEAQPQAGTDDQSWLPSMSRVQARAHQMLPPESTVPLASASVPRPDRRSPGLALNLDPQASASRTSLALGLDRPSPPVPAKSPLRRLSKPAHARNGSADSLAMLGGGSGGGSGSASASASDTESLYIPTTEEALLRGSSRIAAPAPTRSRGVPFPKAEQRYTQQSLVSMYSDDSAPPSARTAYFTGSGGGGDMISEDESPRTMATRMFGDIQSEYATMFEGDTVDGVTLQKRQSRKDSFGWGRKRGESWASRSSIPDVPATHDDFTETRPNAKTPQLKPLSIPSEVLGQTLVDTPSSAVTQKANSFSTSVVSVDAVNGHTPSSARSPTTSFNAAATATPVKSPSMPVANLGHGTPPPSASRQLGGKGSTTPQQQQQRSATDSTGLIPAPFIRSPTSSSFPSSGLSGTSTPGSGLSKRAHLIREIATTERSYANDLALVRDAFLDQASGGAGGGRPRPTSSHSTVDVNGIAAPSPGDVGDSTAATKRSSFFSSDARRLSVQSIASLKGPWSASVQTLPKSPSESIGLSGSNAGGGLASPGSYFTSPGGGGGSGMVSSPSLQNLSTPQPSPRSSSLASRQQQHHQLQRMQSTPGAKPLSPVDLRNVFLNIEQLANAAEELASAFEKAIGEEANAASAPASREGDAGTDRVGEVFTDLLPKLSPLYMFYCSRQSTASVRLMELQSDPGHAAYLNDCWSRIKPHTHAWNLDSMLIKPVQRITKYPLLFDDLLASTTPVHPDYFRIRTAAEMARSLAREIDDAKRRKDVVAGVIKKVPGGGSLTPGGKADASGKGLKGLKLFGGGKKNASSATLVGTASPGSRIASSSSAMSASTITLADTAAPPDIQPASLAYFRELSGKLDAADICVKKTGKEIVLWTAAAKEVFVAQEGLIRTWMKVVRLEEMDPPDKRLIAFRKNLADAIDDAWGPLNAQVKEQILPSLARLVQAVSNPRRVVARRDSKAADYARYQALKEARRPIEPAIQDSARDFAALHTQLVEELPIFLDGVNRAFDLAIVDFARVQAAYHKAVLRNLQRFAATWNVIPPSSTGPTHPANVVSLDDDSSLASQPDLSTYHGIAKAFKQAWTPYAEAVADLHTTRPQKNLATRLATFQSRPGTLSHSTSRSSSRDQSRQASPSRSPRSSATAHAQVPSAAAIASSRSRPQLHHSRSSASQRDLQDVRARDGSAGAQQHNLRPRSTSLINNGLDGSGGTTTRSRPPMLMLPPTSPLRISTNPSPVDDYASSGTGRAHRTHPNNLSGSSLDALGFGSTATSSGRQTSTVSGSATKDESGMSARSSPGADSTIGAGRQRSNYKPDSPRMEGMMRLSQLSQTSPRSDPTSMPATRPSGTKRHTADSSARSSRSGTSEREAAEGWRGEEVLYQCGAVADFDPRIYGDKRYRKLRFLPITTGDLFDVFYEVGRVSDLPAFPYADLVYERDGLLVGQAENGDIGLLICSFLEPLT